MAFRVGQKVVCVDAGPSWDGETSLLEKDRVYTVGAICGLTRGVLLIEVDVGPNYLAFRPTRFRPVAERSTDISVFTAMLTPSKQTVDVH